MNGASHCYRGDHGPGARRQWNGDALDEVRAGFTEEGEELLVRRLPP
jgi:hypothetical protein